MLALELRGGILTSTRELWLQRGSFDCNATISTPTLVLDLTLKWNLDFEIGICLSILELQYDGGDWGQ
jgi:hypothetical protein